MSRVRPIVETMSFLTEYNEPRELSVIDTSAVKMEGDCALPLASSKSSTNYRALPQCVTGRAMRTS